MNCSMLDTIKGDCEQRLCQMPESFLHKHNTELLCVCALNRLDINRWKTSAMRPESQAVMQATEAATNMMLNVFALERHRTNVVCASMLVWSWRRRKRRQKDTQQTDTQAHIFIYVSIFAAATCSLVWHSECVRARMC